jgi:SPW repeat
MNEASIISVESWRAFSMGSRTAGMGRMTTVTRWQDWASFALGLWLAVSPWVLGYSHQEAPTANAAFIGLALALCSHFEISFDDMSVEWFNLAAGLWLVLAPFPLGFSTQVGVAANAILVGAAVAALAGSALSLEKGVGKLWRLRSAPVSTSQPSPQQRKASR